MSLFFGRRADQRAMEWWGTDSTPPGARVTPESATYLAPVFAALRHIVDYGSTLPVDAFRKNGETRTPSTLPLLLRSQNAEGRAGLEQWVGQCLYGLAAYGNSVGWIVETDGMGFPSVVRWLRRIDWSFDEETKTWRVYGSVVSPSNLIHIPWIVPTGCTLGLSPIEHFAALVRAGLSAQDYADVQRGGGIPPAILKNSRLTLDPEAAAQVQAKAVTSFASGKPFVAGADWDLSLLSIPPNHAQFIETMKLSANAIASIYGLDPREVGGSAESSLTYTTDESRSLNRANNMRPYIVRFEDAINRRLPERQFIKLNVDATIRADLKTRTEVVGAKLKDGRMSVDEARALEDQGPVPGGDRYNVPAPTADPATREGDPS